MFRFLLPLAVISFLVFSPVPVRQVRAAAGSELQNVEPMVIEGAVVSASVGQLSLRTADGKEHSFKPDEMTRINVNGKPGKLEELKAGVQVRVMVDKMSKVVSISTVDDRK